MIWISRIIHSGTKKYAHLTGDSQREVEQMARRLRVQIHGKGNQEAHLDINEHQAQLALKYGARKIGE